MEESCTGTKAVLSSIHPRCGRHDKCYHKVILSKKHFKCKRGPHTLENFDIVSVEVEMRPDNIQDLGREYPQDCKAIDTGLLLARAIIFHQEDNKNLWPAILYNQGKTMEHTSGGRYTQ